MDRLAAIIMLLVILVVGLWRILHDYRVVNQKMQLTNEFATKFIKYATRSGNVDDSETYVWLTSNVDEMQNDMAEFGTLLHYRRPYSNTVYREYPLILNVLPLIMRGQATRDDFLACQDGFIRYTAWLNKIITEYSKRLKNPFRWFREGMQYLLLIPIRLLSWLGFINTRMVNAAENFPLTKLITGLITVAGLMGTIITIVVGWEPFLLILRNVINRN